MNTLRWILVLAVASVLFAFVLHNKDDQPKTFEDTYAGDYGNLVYTNNHMTADYKVEIKTTSWFDHSMYITNFVVKMWRMRSNDLPIAITARGWINNNSPEDMRIVDLWVIDPTNESCQYFWTLRNDRPTECLQGANIAKTRIIYQNKTIPPMMYAKALSMAYDATYQFYAPFHEMF